MNGQHSYQTHTLIFWGLALFAAGGCWAARKSGRTRMWEVFVILLTAFLALSFLPDPWAVRLVTLLHP